MYIVEVGPSFIDERTDLEGYDYCGDEELLIVEESYDFSLLEDRLTSGL